MGVFLVVVEEMRPLLVQKFSRLRREFTSVKNFRAFGANLLTPTAYQKTVHVLKLTEHEKSQMES